MRQMGDFMLIAFLIACALEKNWIAVRKAEKREGAPENWIVD
jgi:hypothetical protein